MSDSYLDQCPHCTMRFVNASAIPEHIREAHPNAAPSEPPPVEAKTKPDAAPAPQALTCEHCGSEVRNRAGLSAHIRYKHPEIHAASPANAASA